MCQAFIDCNADPLHKYEVWCCYSCFTGEETDAQRVYLLKVTVHVEQIFKADQKVCKLKENREVCRFFDF